MGDPGFQELMRTDTKMSYNFSHQDVDIEFHNDKVVVAVAG